MRLSLLPLCSGLVVTTVSAALANVNFLDERQDPAQNSTGNKGNPGISKYFFESDFSGHYDGRYANKSLSREEQTSHLATSIRAYLTFMDEIGVETWIMHGTLLAWWWNQKIFPWDDDVDMQVSYPGINFLAENYNMTERHFDIPGVPGGRTYVLDINPHYIIPSTLDRHNVIDGRWIDTSSGLFIDITAVRADKSRRPKGNVGVLMCKDGHRYRENDLFPLRRSVFEGTPTKVPYAYTALLGREYGLKSMTTTKYNGYNFSVEDLAWIKNVPIRKPNDTALENGSKFKQNLDEIAS